MRLGYIEKVATVGLLVLITLFLGSCVKKDTVSLEEYGEFFKDDYAISGGIDIFPVNLSNVKSVDQYLFKYYDSLLASQAQVILNCTYDKDTFDKEVERISSWGWYENNNANQTQLWYSPVEYVEHGFNYPAYTTYIDEGRIYQYILVDESEYRLIYVHLQYCPIEEVKFDHVYLPKSYHQISP